MEELPLTFETETGHKLINFNKLRHTATVILNLQMFQLNKHHFVVSDSMKSYINNYAIVADDGILYELSKKIEPKSP
jgi:hypothetical protein